jgi:hypothetical protein
MNAALKAGGSYLRVLFVAGFIPGTVRVMVLVGGVVSVCAFIKDISRRNTISGPIVDIKYIEALYWFGSEAISVANSSIKGGIP